MKLNPQKSEKMSAQPQCPVCTTISKEPINRINNYAIHRCKKCQLQFSDPMKHPGAEWYEKSPHYKYMAARSVTLPLWLIWTDWRFKTAMALKLKPKGRVLDVGCGSGAFLRLAKAFGYQVGGIDVSETAIRTVKEKFGINNVYEMSVEELVTKAAWKNSYDIICLFDVLEHLENPVEALAGLKNVLKTGGYIVCTVPCYQRWPPIFDPYVDNPPHHLTLWTPSALEKCLSAAGFGAIKIIKSPLRTEQLWPHMIWRLRPFLQQENLNTLVKAVTYFLIAPPITKILSIKKEAGGFTIMGIAQKSGDKK